ncbi:hypothetical protein PRIC1_004538 [Phytophthora ramorum]
MNISELAWASSEASSSQLRGAGGRSPNATEAPVQVQAALPTFTLAKPPEHPATNSTKKGLSATTTDYAVVPDKDRKRPNRLSATQKQFRRDNEAYESRVLNLTLDINHLRQEILHLMSCRDLQVTRLLLEREERESNALRVVDSILFGVEEGRGVPSLCTSSPTYNGCSFSGTLLGQTGSVPPLGVYEFTLLLDKPTCHHSSGVSTATQVLSFVEENTGTDTDEAADIRRMCGEPGGCVIESVGDLAGRLSREVLISMFPPLARDRMLMARLVGLSITCSARLLLFFDSRQRLVRQIAQTDIFEVLNAVQQARPAELATILGRDARS